MAPNLFRDTFAKLRDRHTHNLIVYHVNNNAVNIYDTLNRVTIFLRFRLSSKIKLLIRLKFKLILKKLIYKIKYRSSFLISLLIYKTQNLCILDHFFIIRIRNIYVSNTLFYIHINKYFKLFILFNKVVKITLRFHKEHNIFRSLSEPGKCNHASGFTKGNPLSGRRGFAAPTPKCNPWNRPWRARQTRMEALASRCARACGAFHSGASKLRDFKKVNGINEEFKY
ncbi:hypothetical protein DBV15_10579 [Temnothorax longispinosus]|uniref:Uncharacterized protein n=1 Tax=Temnothorax longispinosus TaxID=300112 RepID=A0A4S2JMS8_9HYME|nr:hypothetical protein DBV15_10579 [Temnothorax longispinosus]